jgi:tripartite-type tricarboxylate transporter receptor subunit TctC
MRVLNVLKAVISTLPILICGSALAAPKWPTGPITIIVPYAPGGAVDITARLLQKPIGDILGQSVIVDNRAGGAGLPAAQAVIHAAPDGYTIGLFGSNFVTSTVLYRHPPYNAVTDVTPLTMVAKNTTLIVVPPNSKIHSLADLIAAAKAAPNTIGFATPGFGTAQFMATEQFMLSAQIQMVDVPYRGAGPATTDVVGGHVPVGFLGIGPTSPFVRSGKLRALAITTTPRSPIFPNVPTVAEEGFPGFDYGEWFGMIAPKGLPKDVAAKLESAVVKAVDSTEFKNRLLALGLEAYSTSPSVFAHFMASERARLAILVQKAHLQIH